MRSKLELIHFRKIIAAFFNYKVDSMRDVARMDKDLYQIGPKYQKYIKEAMDSRRERLIEAIQVNSTFLYKVVYKYHNIF